MDLTILDEHRMILRALQEAADHLAIGLAVIQVSEPIRVLYVNESAAAIFGRPRAELEGGSPFVVLAPEFAERERARLAERGTGGTPPLVLETVAQRPDGTRVPIEVSMTRVVTESASLNVTFMRDISARVQAVETLRQSEERFRRVVEGAPDGVVILQRGRISFVNELGAQLLGLPDRKSGIGMPIADLLIAEDAARAGERIGRMMSTGATFDPMEYHPKAAPDRVVEIKSIVIDRDGERAVLAFARDVSARKRIEQELVRADRLASIGMMSAAVAHEINNPLAYVNLCLQFLERELPNLLHGEARERVLEQVRNASHGIERVATIVRDLRTFARSDNGELGSVDVVACIEQAIKLVDNEIRHHAQLVRDFESVPAVHANASRLEQVFVNVLINAAQAMSGGPEGNEVRVSVRAKESRVIIAISDTGPGIPSELRERVFEPFFSTKAVGIGTGLGLAVCRSIVEQFGGTIEAAAGATRGTVLTVTLPAHRGVSAPDPVRSATATIAAKRRRVLIVDDEPLVRRALATVLGSHHDVVVAENGQRAIEQLAAHAVDVVVCDMMMPVMNGKELYEHLQVNEPELARRFVFITGGSLGSVSGFLEQTDALVLYKPFELSKVLEMVAVAAEK